METLWRVVLSMKQAADLAGVQVVTGDTKVVDKGQGGRSFYQYFGNRRPSNTISSSVRPASKPGDAVLLSGDIGRHGINRDVCSRGTLDLKPASRATARRSGVSSKPCSTRVSRSTACAI